MLRYKSLVLFSILIAISAGQSEAARFNLIDSSRYTVSQVIVYNENHRFNEVDTGGTSGFTTTGSQAVLSDPGNFFEGNDIYPYFEATAVASSGGVTGDLVGVTCSGDLIANYTSFWNYEMDGDGGGTVTFEVLSEYGNEGEEIEAILDIGGWHFDSYHGFGSSVSGDGNYGTNTFDVRFEDVISGAVLFDRANVSTQEEILNLIMGHTYHLDVSYTSYMFYEDSEYTPFNRFEAEMWADVILTGGESPDINPVPEPGTIVLLGTGLVGLIAARRKSKKSE